MLQFLSLWSINPGLQIDHMTEARNTTVCCSRSHFHPQILLTCKFICLQNVPLQMVQVDIEDSGTSLATKTNPTINDEKCNRGYCSICEVAAPVRRVTIRGLCDLSIFDRSTHPFSLKLLAICTSS